MPRSERLWLLALVAAFCARGVFYSIEQPIWEGFDEWAHVSYLSHLSSTGRPPHRLSPVSSAVAQSLQITPLAPAAASEVPGSMSHDEFWALEESAQTSRRTRLAQLSDPVSTADQTTPSLRNYEAQQPPLYCLLLHPIYKYLASRAGLAAAVLCVRLATVLLASCVVISAFYLARCITGSSVVGRLAALVCVVSPGFMIATARVANDALAAALTGSFLYLCCTLIDNPNRPQRWAVTGAVLGAMLLSKAYCLAMAPLVVITALLAIYVNEYPWKRACLHLTIALAITTTIAGWWFADTWLQTGTLSGEQFDIHAAHPGVTTKLTAIAEINWRRVLDTMAFTHLWTGGWSFLSVRSWMYRVLEAVIALALVGVGLQLFRRIKTGSVQQPTAAKLSLIAAAMLLMLAGLAYHSVMVYVATNTSVALGWYVYNVMAAEAAIIVVGLEASFRRMAAVAVVLFAVLDLYTMHLVSMPYHTGLTLRTAGGAVRTLAVSSLADAFPVMLSRLFPVSVLQLSRTIVLSLWVLYAFATVAACVLACYSTSTESAD